MEEENVQVPESQGAETVQEAPEAAVTPEEGAAAVAEGGESAGGGESATVEDPREQYFAMLRERFPDEKFEDDIDYYKKGLGLVSDLDGKISQYDVKNQELFDLLDDEPLLGLILADFKEGKSLPYIIGHYFDRDEVFSDKEDEDDWLAGSKLREERIAEKKRKEEMYRDNFAKTGANFESFKKEHEMSDEELDEFKDKMLNILQSAQEGLISPEFLGVIFKGLAYDADMKTAAEQGRINGRNEKIDIERRSFGGDGLPDTAPSNHLPVDGKNESSDMRRMIAHMKANDVWAQGGYVEPQKRKR